MHPIRVFLQWTTLLGCTVSAIPTHLDQNDTNRNIVHRGATNTPTENPPLPIGYDASINLILARTTTTTFHHATDSDDDDPDYDKKFLLEILATVLDPVLAQYKEFKDEYEIRHPEDNSLGPDDPFDKEQTFRLFALLLRTAAEEFEIKAEEARSGRDPSAYFL